MHLALPEFMVQLDQDTLAPLDLRRGKAERRILGYCYATVGAGFARMLAFSAAHGGGGCTSTSPV